MQQDLKTNNWKQYSKAETTNQCYLCFFSVFYK